MLATRRTAFGADSWMPAPTLAALKARVDQCLRALPIRNSDAGFAATCAAEVASGMRAQEKQTLIENADRMLLFNIAANLLTQWRNTAADGVVDDDEAEIRRIAAEKLAETADAVSPTLAVQHLSSSGRIETDPLVLLRIANGLRDLLIEHRTIPPSVKTEALTTLRILADPYAQPNLGVRMAAVVALDLISKRENELDMGPVTVTPAPSTRSKYLIPIVAVTGTALASAGVLWFILSRSAHSQFASAGPLRRKVESRLRQQRRRR